jgi:hypothetical protein
MTTAHILSRYRSPSVGTRISYAINIKIVLDAHGAMGGIDFFGKKKITITFISRMHPSKNTERVSNHSTNAAPHVSNVLQNKRDEFCLLKPYQ